jgi:RimJ/RimL family protein N-acetyltransferase
VSAFARAAPPNRHHAEVVENLDSSDLGVRFVGGAEAMDFAPLVEINTERLIMRGWRESDLAPWAAMNADPEVRRYLGPLLTFEQSCAWVLNFQDDLDRGGFGFWAVEVRASVEFIGFTGLDTVDDEMPFTGIEVGWRLARPAWGHGYATEAGLAALEYGFDVMGLPEILAVTMARNLRSQAVMRRIGMTTDPAEDFDDADVDESQMRRHVVYRKRRTA